MRNDWFCDIIERAALSLYESRVMREVRDEEIFAEAYEKLLSHSQIILYLGDRYRVIFLEKVENEEAATTDRT